MVGFSGGEWQKVALQWRTCEPQCHLDGQRRAGRAAKSTSIFAILGVMVGGLRAISLVFRGKDADRNNVLESGAVVEPSRTRSSCRVTGDARYSRCSGGVSLKDCCCHCGLMRNCRVRIADFCWDSRHAD